MGSIPGSGRSPGDENGNVGSEDFLVGGGRVPLVGTCIDETSVVIHLVDVNERRKTWLGYF